MRRAARKFWVNLSTVQYWVQRARHQRLDAVEWADQPRGPGTPPNRTPRQVEDRVLSLRTELKETSALGEYGAQAIYREMATRGLQPLPHPRTIGRILERRGALDGRRRLRRAAPPPGWYLPEVASKEAELDQFDFVEGLVIRGGTEVEVLTKTSLHGGLEEAWPAMPWTAKMAVESLITHWRAFGLPAYAQFDNDTRFQGAHQYRDVVGQATRLCLSLRVTPVFVPPREPGFQARLENFNGRWQAKVWARFEHESLAALQTRSHEYIVAARARAASRIEGAPPRRSFPADWKLDLQAPLGGRIIYLRRTNDKGYASVLGYSFAIAPDWSHRLVRAEVDLDAGTIRFYALRRREPTWQPLLGEITHRLPQRRFKH